MAPRLLLRAAGAVVLLLAAVAASRADEKAPASDSQIQSKVESALVDHDIVNVKAAVSEGNVTLAGSVPSLDQKQRAIQVVRKVEGVRAVADQIEIPRAESDDALAEQVAQGVATGTFYSVYDDASVAVHDGVVSLTGHVTEPHKSQEMAAAAARVPGVREVRNQIQVLPVSINDDRLRVAIANAIYNDPLFARAASMTDPPIHIVVDNGKVILAGAVGSEVEKVKAEADARGVFGVMSVENRLVIEK
jgi:hyperosmotically inducible protein